MRQRILHILMPVLLLIAMIFLMAGCLYIPTFEVLHKSGTTEDFRSLLDVNRRGHLVVGKTNRATVVSLLGAPPFKSANGRAVAYVMESHQDVWFIPLCLGVGPAVHRTYVLELVYNEKDIVARLHFQRAMEDQPVVPVIQLEYIMPNRPSHFSPLLYKIIRDLNSASDQGNRLERVDLGDSRTWTYGHSETFGMIMRPPSTQPQYKTSSQP